jgi:hypothetical protein
VLVPVPGAYALTGADGSIAIATTNGIEVFDPSGDGSDLHVLVPNEPGVAILQEPAWSPTGGRIAFTAWTDQGFLLWVAASDGSGAHPITSDEENAYDPAWSPDGRLAYLRDGSTVVIADADGSHTHVVDFREELGRPNLYTVWRPSWTADGRLVLLLAEPGVMALSPFIADGDGTHLRPLTYPDGRTPELSDLSSNWQFSSTGLVAFEVFDDQEIQKWVHFASFDGKHIVEAPGDVTSDLDARDDVALAPTGERAVVSWPDFPSPGRTGISIWDADLTSSTDSLHGTGGFDIPGTVTGIDWQPTCSITGTPGDDELRGTPGSDLVCGLGGDDVIRGMGGNDVIYGGPGNDAIHGGPGNDVLVGGAGSDELRGGRERDLINSRRDARAPDVVSGGPGHDVCLHDRADLVPSC